MGHRPRRPRQPAVLHHPCPQAHRIHYPTAQLAPTLARLTVPRSFDGDRQFPHNPPLSRRRGATPSAAGPHRDLILNYFRARKEFSSGVIEGLNNKAKVTMRKSYGFRTFRVTELALYHSLGKLPEPELTHDFSDESVFQVRRRAPLLPPVSLRMRSCRERG
jgi:hypothetical protein